MQTKNLLLVPQAPEHVLALIEGPDHFERSFGYPAAEGLRDFIVSPDVSPHYLATLHTTTGPNPWTHGFALVHAADRKVIGSAGFKGPPTADGMVEIAYGIVPTYRGKGLATEGAQALVTYAFADGRVRLVLAHTLPEPNASTRVLLKCGFRHVGEVMDPEDGRVWRWEKHEDA